MWRRRFYGTVPWGCDARDIGNLGGTSGACPHVAGAVALATAAANGVPPASDVFDALRKPTEGKNGTDAEATESLTPEPPWTRFQPEE